MSRRTRTGEDTSRSRLLQATLELVSERGYLGASTRDIAGRAGVSELTLFRKFGNKEALFEQVLATYTFLPRLRDLLAAVEGRPLREGLERIGCRYMETLRERKDLIRIMISEINTYPKKVRKLHADFIKTMERSLEGYLRVHRDAGALRAVPLGHGARTFFQLLFSSFLSEEIIGGREPSSKAVAALVSRQVDIFLNGISSGDRADRAG